MSCKNLQLMKRVSEDNTALVADASPALLAVVARF
jgi:hypothetical protein